MMNKKKFLLYLFFCTCFCPNGESQDSLRIYNIKYKKTVFITIDSVYDFTMFIEPNGKFYFKKGYADTPLSDRYFYKLDKHGGITERYHAKYEYQLNCIDTIYSYFFDNSILTCQQDKVGDELEASYILRQFKESVLYNTDSKIIRILFPNDLINFSSSFDIYSINFSSDSLKIYHKSGCTSDYNGINITKIDSVPIKLRDKNRLEKKLIKLNHYSENIYCPNPGSPLIMEYNNNGVYRYFVISLDCCRDNKELKPIVSTFLFLIQLYNKYLLYK